MRLRMCKPKEVVHVLKKVGFGEIRQVGGHLTMGNRTGRLVTVPMHSGDMKRGLLFSIIKDAGLTKEEFAQLL